MASSVSMHGAGKRFADVLDQLRATNGPVIVEDAGRAVAVVLSPQEYTRLTAEAARVQQPFEIIDAIRARNAAVAAEQVEQDVTAAVEVVRQEPRRRR